MLFSIAKYINTFCSTAPPRSPAVCPFALRLLLILNCQPSPNRVFLAKQMKHRILNNSFPKEDSDMPSVRGFGFETTTKGNVSCCSGKQWAAIAEEGGRGREGGGLLWSLATNKIVGSSNTHLYRQRTVGKSFHLSLCLPLLIVHL